MDERHLVGESTRDEDHALEFDDDDNADGPGFSPEPDASRNPCRSIIAVEGTRRGDLADGLGGRGHGVPDGADRLSFEGAEEGGDSGEGFVCERHDGATVPVVGTATQMAALRELLHAGELVSARSVVEVEPVGGKTAMMATVGISEGATAVTLPAGDIRLVRGPGDGDGDGRRLNRNSENMFLGDKKVLVVRVTDKEGRAIKEDAEYVSDKFFGTYGDRVTAKSGLEACSLGQFVATNDYDGAVPENRLAAPGVLDVALDVRLTHVTQEALVRAATTAAGRALGVALPGPFDHVAFVVEGCYAVGGGYCGFNAYAYINHWLSVFFGLNYRYPAVVSTRERSLSRHLCVVVAHRRRPSLLQPKACSY